MAGICLPLGLCKGTVKESISPMGLGWHIVWVMKWFLTDDLYFLILCDGLSHMKSLFDVMRLSDEIVPLSSSWWNGLPVSFIMKWFATELPYEVVCQWALSLNDFSVIFIIELFASDLLNKIIQSPFMFMTEWFINCLNEISFISDLHCEIICQWSASSVVVAFQPGPKRSVWLNVPQWWNSDIRGKQFFSALYHEMIHQWSLSLFK